jgi:hypothetical protein
VLWIHISNSYRHYALHEQKDRSRLPNNRLHAPIKTLRRLLAIALLAVFGLPFVSPLFALSATSGTSLPACCRRDGKHHCAMTGEEAATLSSDTQAFNAPPQQCPYYPASIAIVHGDLFALPAAQAVYAGLIAHPAVVAQTESKLRISRARSRQKRGPPSSLSL